MNRNQAKEFYPILQAFAEGKVIETRTDPNVVGKGLKDMNDWTEMNEIEYWNNIEYRIKPESTYRPFKDKEECWNEMLKHQPFGWIYSKNVSCYYCIISVDEDKIELSPEMQPHSETTIKEYYMENSYVGFVTALEDYEYTFADGTPFGIKEE